MSELAIHSLFRVPILTATKMRFSQSLAVICLITVLSGVAQANNLAPVCTANTLAFYIQVVNSDAPCSVGILNFEGFSFNSAGSATLDTAADIKVTPNPVGGFSFSQVNTLQFSVVDGTTATYDIGYHFVIDAGPVVDAASIEMDPPFGTASIDEFFCADSNFSQDGASASPFCIGRAASGPQDLHVDDTRPPFSWSTGFVPLNPPALVDGSVLTRILLGNGTTGGGFDTVNEGLFTVDPSAPEPSTIILLLSGLGAMAVLRRRRKAA
jgi:hypothetical protein